MATPGCVLVRVGLTKRTEGIAHTIYICSYIFERFVSVYLLHNVYFVLLLLDDSTTGISWNLVIIRDR
jgi:hypothetical protein